MERTDTIKTGWMGWGLILLTVIVIYGCGGNFGRVQSSREITGIFMQKQVLSQYNYYYAGRRAIPYAVVGIKKDYVLDTTFWTPVGKEKGQFNGLIDRLYGSDFKSPYGADIIDPQGNPVGIWYSVYNTTRVQFGPDNQVNVFSPYTPSRHSGLIY